jgi:dihydroorotate dehydrogenase electron transfer subunit
LFNEYAKVESQQKINDSTFLLRLHAPSIASMAMPGQFCNVKVSETTVPLLRRPFSISNVEGDSIFFMYDLHGEGTKVLSKKSAGDEIEILGPLGKGFCYDGEYKTAVLIAGGLGSAPFPFLTKNLHADKNVITLVGARNKSLLLTLNLKNVSTATDDGSGGYHGTVIDLLKQKIQPLQADGFRIFACGPNPMLKALQQFCNENNYDCQISVEGAMACGFGICQGCPIEAADEDKYLLVCKDGPVFDSKAVKL